MLETLGALASIATAIAVVVGAWQLVLSHRQAVTSFEDSLAKEYRDIAAKLPTQALLGEPIDDDEYMKHFDEMYHYLDLCNQQVFLRQRRRISKKTWAYWSDGISSNLKRPAFERAWSEVAARSNGDFSELREIFPPKPYLARAAEPNKFMHTTCEDARA